MYIIDLKIQIIKLCLERLSITICTHFNYQQYKATLVLLGSKYRTPMDLTYKF